MFNSDPHIVLGGVTAGCGKSDKFPDEDAYVEEEDADVREEESAAEEEMSEKEESTEKAEAPAEETEAPVEEEKPEEEAEEEKSALEAENFVIYDAEGVKVTLENVKLDDLDSAAVFTLTNNNPDNKKVIFDGMIGLNGVYAGGWGAGSVSVGETYSEDWNMDYGEYKEIVEKLGETLESMPIETIECCYMIQIGSDSEFVMDMISFQTSQYKGGLYEKGYGEKIYEDSIGSDRLEAYLKQSENGTMITVKNNNAVDAEQAYAGGLPWGVDMVCAKGSFPAKKHYMVLNNTQFLWFDKTASDIRGEYEIPNDEPLGLQVHFRNWDDGAEADIPVLIED